MKRGSAWAWLAMPLVLLLGLHWRAQHKQIQSEILGAALLRQALQAEEQRAYRAEMVVTTLQGDRFETNYALITRQGPRRYRCDYKQGSLAGGCVGCDGVTTWQDLSPGAGVQEAACLPILSGQDLAELVLRNYQVEYAGETRWDGQPVWQLIIRPHRRGRPWERVLIDAQTSLPLLTERWSEEGRRISRVVRRNLQLLRSGEIPAGFFSPAAGRLRPAGSGGSANGNGGPSTQGLGFRPRPPRGIPAGYRFANRGLYACPCGCGMKAAEWHYTDGLQTLSVFQTRPDFAGCVFPGGCPVANDRDERCLLQELGATRMAVATEASLICVVVGYLPAGQLQRIARQTVGR